MKLQRGGGCGGDGGLDRGASWGLEGKSVGLIPVLDGVHRYTLVTFKLPEWAHGTPKLPMRVSHLAYG